MSGGPFEGMRYVPISHGSVLGAKLLGTYEMELHPWIHRILLREHDVCHVVGCAEGYYAVGMARRNPSIRVFAYDIDPSALAAVRWLAVLNGVGERVDCIRGFNAGSIPEYSFKRPLVICDVEGDEGNVLDLAVAGFLAHADILVELHDGLDSSAKRDLIGDRFSETHTIEHVRARPRVIQDAPQTALSALGPQRSTSCNERGTDIRIVVASNVSEE